jgi:SnoaL-like domain
MKMDSSEVLARESIRDLVARYNSNGDSGRFDEVLALFADDAVMELPGGVLYEGLEMIATVFTGTQQNLKTLPAEGVPTYIRHYTATHQIDILDGQSARGRCYYQVLMPHGLDHWGRYLDSYTFRDGRWLFSRRKVTMDGFVDVPGGMGKAAAEA